MNYSIARLLGRSTAARFILDSCGRGEERSEKKEEESSRGIPEIRMDSEILESSHSAPLPFRILPASRPRSRYVFLYAPPVLVTIFTE